VIARMEVEQVTAFVDVNEWSHIGPAVCIYCAHIRYFLPTQELRRFRRLREPSLTIHAST